ncbi:Transposase [Olavius algarvensis associated proteobacterium Delta 3]|nr:Transposase [Olavius algarvensis associated proteobacterium Delta 3]
MSKSGYYAWATRSESSHTKRRRCLAKRIVRVFENSKGRYGSPKVYQALLRQGVRCSENTVAKIMRSKGLKARVNRVYVRNPKLHRFFGRIGNLRIDQPPPDRINKVWVGDLTYIRRGKRFVYLATVMDVHSRRIVGWSMGERKNVNLTNRALMHAIRKRHPPRGLIFHSDRGVEYCAYRYHDTLDRYGITHSVNRPGCCQDNAHMESFYHTIKGELIRNREFRNGRQLRNEVKGYIIHFYNKKRLHSALGYYSPIEFEQQTCNDKY